MRSTEDQSDYHWYNAEVIGAHAYVWSSRSRILAQEAPPSGAPRIFDPGCGKRVTAHWRAGLGYEVAGIDTSQQGMAQAKNAYPELHLEVGSVYDDLAASFGRYPVV